MKSRSKNPKKSISPRLACEMVWNKVNKTLEEVPETTHAAQQLRRAARHLELAMRHLGNAEKNDGKEDFTNLVTSVSDHLMQSIGTPVEPANPELARSGSMTLNVKDGGKKRRRRGFRGYTQAISLADLINFLCVQGRDGVLTVTTSTETVELYFEMGNLIHARSNSAPKGTRLGEILVQHGHVEQEVLDAFLLEAGDSTQRIGEALERDEIVGKQELRQALEAQAQSLFLRLFEEEDAYFAFSEGLPEDSDRRINLNITHLVLESARIKDESSLEDFGGVEPETSPSE